MGQDEWETAGRESHHRALLKAWSEKKDSWSGSGKHVKDNEIKYTMPSKGEELGNGVATVVEKIHYRSLPLARKLVRGHRYRPISELRKEAEIMEKIVHHHIVILVGSYTSSLRQHTLYLLIYPAATCDLKTFLHDIDDIRHGSPHSIETAKRFESLGFKQVLPNPQSSSSQPTDFLSISWDEPLKYLCSILGCITEAVTYIHDKKIRHSDLKPENILLMPNRVYVADFGISKNLENAANSLTEGYTGGTRMYQSPEASEKREHHMSPSEIYSLGAIFLGIATALHGENQSQFDSIMKEPEVRLKASKITSFLCRLRNVNNEDSRKGILQTNGQKPIIDLIDTMLDFEPSNRPTPNEVSHSLLETGGQDQVYHGECCRKNAVQLAYIRGSIIKSLETKKAAQMQELRALQAKLQLNDAKVHSLEKELNVVRDSFASRIETEKREVSNSWHRYLEAEKRAHESSKTELEHARRKIKKLEDDNQKLKFHKDKRNYTQDGKGLSPSTNGNDRDGASTPSRIPIMRNHSSPRASPKPFNSPAKLSGTNKANSFNPKTPLQTQESDDSDLYSMMASGMTLVDSVSSISPHSSAPPSPSTAKSIAFKIPETNASSIETHSVKVSGYTSKSYADMLKPGAGPKTNGIEKSTIKHSNSIIGFGARTKNPGIIGFGTRPKKPVLLNRP